MSESHSVEVTGARPRTRGAAWSGVSSEPGITCVANRKPSHLVKDGRVESTSGNPSAVAEAVQAFFAEHASASLRLPSGWFGRPFDNLHRLTKVATEHDDVVVRLDDRQVLVLHAEAVSSQDRILRLSIRGGRWDWIEYGGTREHTEVLGPGDVEFHAPVHG